MKSIQKLFRQENTIFLLESALTKPHPSHCYIKITLFRQLQSRKLDSLEILTDFDEIRYTFSLLSWSDNRSAFLNKKLFL